MTGGATTFKLGVLALISLAAVIATAFLLGMQSTRAPSVSYHTYFDESVQGLETGSPVKFRGVRIGNVTAIRIAPDGRRVDVTLSIERAEVVRLQLERPELRAQLGTQGITGVKYVDIDFFGKEPPDPLPFPPAARHIPSRRSMLKGLEMSVDNLLERVPRILDRTLDALDRVDTVLADFDRAAVPARIASAIDGVTAAARQVRAFVVRVDRANVPATTAQLLARANASLAKVDDALARFGRAVDRMGELGQRASGSTEQFDRAMDDISEAARTLRELLDEIERDPDMLIKGRARSKRR